MIKIYEMEKSGRRKKNLKVVKNLGTLTRNINQRRRRHKNKHDHNGAGRPSPVTMSDNDFFK